MKDLNEVLICVVIIAFFIGGLFMGCHGNNCKIKQILLKNNVAYFDKKTGNFTYRKLTDQDVKMLEHNNER